MSPIAYLPFEGDVILYGIDLVDEMLGGAAGEAELVSGNASDIVLNPGVAVDLVYKYVVQPGDIANNALKNKLTALFLYHVVVSNYLFLTAGNFTGNFQRILPLAFIKGRGHSCSDCTCSGRILTIRKKL